MARKTHPMVASLRAADTGKILWETYTVPKMPGDLDRGQGEI